MLRHEKNQSRGQEKITVPRGTNAKKVAAEELRLLLGGFYLCIIMCTMVLVSAFERLDKLSETVWLWVILIACSILLFKAKEIDEFYITSFLLLFWFIYGRVLMDYSKSYYLDDCDTTRKCGWTKIFSYIFSFLVYTPVAIGTMIRSNSVIHRHPKYVLIFVLAFASAFPSIGSNPVIDFEYIIYIRVMMFFFVYSLSVFTNYHCQLRRGKHYGVITGLTMIHTLFAYVIIAIIITMALGMFMCYEIARYDRKRSMDDMSLKKNQEP